jgi:LPS sulfotransferase NodH
VDTRYVAGRWHPARVSISGIVTEARVAASSVLKPDNRGVHKFLVVCRARSGSTLLTQLLNANPQVTCGREVMSRRILFPRSFLGRLASKSGQKAYGAKLLSYQMVQVQRLGDPAGFLESLAGDGFKFVHLVRDSFAQTLSLYVAQDRKIFHQASQPGKGKASWQPRAEASSLQAMSVDVAAFRRRLEWNKLLLDYEEYCLARLPHIRLSYESDLMKSDAHQATADKVFDWIGVPSAPVTGTLRKLLSEDPRTLIANYDELRTELVRAGLGDLLPE